MEGITWWKTTPYTLQLNPTEFFWFKLKHCLQTIVKPTMKDECQSPSVVPYISYLKEGHSLVCSYASQVCRKQRKCGWWRNIAEWTIEALSVGASGVGKGGQEKLDHSTDLVWFLYRELGFLDFGYQQLRYFEEQLCWSLLYKNFNHFVIAFGMFQEKKDKQHFLRAPQPQLVRWAT